MIELFAKLQEQKRLPTPLRYVITTILVFICFAVRYSIEGQLNSSPYLLFIPSVILAGFLFNHGNSLYALALSAGLAAYFFAPEEGKVLGVLVYLIIGAFVSTLIESLRHAVLKLTKIVKELDQANASLSEAHEKLSNADQKKGLMLREAYHRIKNDLHVALGMLEVQALGVEDPKGRKALASAASRLRVLGFAYERLRLREGSDETIVCSKEFLEGLCDDLKAGLIEGRQVTLRIKADSIELEGTRAVSIGLIVNELVTNALKYAFPDDRQGSVVVNFKCDDTQCVLSVTDDGVGINTDDTRPGGIGKRLVSSLVQQLGGTLETNGAPGTEVKITFPLTSPEGTPCGN